MKKAIVSVVCLLLVLTQKIIAQVDHIKVLVMDTDSTIISYLDSLNSLRPNPLFKIQKDVASDGDLLLQVDFALKDEAFFGCTSLMFRFSRVAGLEVCGRQLIIGGTEYAQRNLNYIKDTYAATAESGTWELSVPEHKFKIVATFSKKDGNNPIFLLMYSFKNM